MASPGTLFLLWSWSNSRQPSQTPDVNQFVCRYSSDLHYANQSIATMYGPEKFVAACELAIARLPQKVKDEIDALYTPAALLTMFTMAGATLAVVAAAHLVAPVGVVMDVMVLAGVASMGYEGFTLAWSLAQAGNCLKSAVTKCDLDEAAFHIANAFVAVSLEAFFTVVTVGFGKLGNVARYAAAATAARAAIVFKAGMTTKHFAAFQRVAASTNRLIIVRNTKSACIKWIERGFPMKSMLTAYIKNCEESGLVTCDLNLVGNFRDPSNMNVMAQELYRSLKAGDWVVDLDGIARNLDGQVFEHLIDWPIESGQIIQKAAKKPYTGDYDIADVIDLDRLQEFIADAKHYFAFGKDNITTSDVQNVMFQMYRETGRPDTIRHGPYAFFDDLINAGDCTFFYPDESVVQRTAQQLRDMYVQWGRPLMPNLKAGIPGPALPSVSAPFSPAAASVAQ